MGREQGDHLEQAEPTVFYRGSEDNDDYEEREAYTPADRNNLWARGWSVKDTSSSGSGGRSRGSGSRGSGTGRSGSSRAADAPAESERA